MNIGIIGFGGMGKTHAYAVENLKYFYSELPFEARIKGVCCAHFENAQEAVRRYGFEKAYESEEELISDPDIDIVDIVVNW